MSKKTTTVINYDNAIEILTKKELEYLLCCDNPNFIADELINKITETIEENTSILNTPKSKRTIKPWISPGIIKCIKNRKKMQKELKQDPILLIG